MTERTKESSNELVKANLAVWDKGETFIVSRTRESNNTLVNHMAQLFWEGCTSHDLYAYDVYNRYCPKPSDKDSKLMSIYENLPAYNAEKRLIGKPGKMIKRILPYLNQLEIEAFSNWYKETFVLSEMGFTVKTGNDRESFKRAYSYTQSPATDCNYNRSYKSLSGSCMRHDFESFPCHPAETYASGDFTVYWIEDSEGRIAARCIAYGNYAGPIYTNSNLATETLENHLESIGITDFDCNFYGAKFLRVKKDYSGFVVPFIDGIEYAKEYGDDHFLIVEDQPSGGYIKPSNTSGYAELESGGESCADCGGTTDEDDATYVEGIGSICPHCLSNNYTQCHDNGEYYLNEETVEVFYYRRGYANSNNYRAEWANENATYCDNESEYWQTDDVIYIQCEDVYVPPTVADDDYFESTVDNEYYPNDEKVETELGNMTKDQAIEADLTLVGETWTKYPEAYNLETIMTELQSFNVNSEPDLVITHNLILRDNFQLDETGKPERNPDLFDNMRAFAISKL